MKQGEIWYANLNPSKESGQAGHRPVVVLSGNLMNAHLSVVICCPLTTKVKNYKGNLVVQPTRDNGLDAISEILTFHIRSISKDRLTKRLGIISKIEIEQLVKNLNEILSY